jgi:hypothetical protein
VNSEGVNDEKNPMGSSNVSGGTNYKKSRRVLGSIQIDDGLRSWRSFWSGKNFFEKSQKIIYFLAKIFRVSGCLCQKEIMLAFLHQKIPAAQFIIAMKLVAGR